MMNEKISPKSEYIEKSLQDSIYLSTSIKKHQLLVLDLNGTLISRVKPGGNYYVRPHYEEFLNYIFQHFHVMVWSSAQEKSVNSMCHIFHKHRKNLRLIWNRSHFELTTHQFYKNVKTIKNLEKVWKVLPEFNETNTIMLDDSIHKLEYQPYNLVHISTFDHKIITSDYELLKVMNYLQLIKQQSNLVSFMRLNPFDFTKSWGIQKDTLTSKMAHYSKKGTRLKDILLGHEDEEDQQISVINDEPFKKRKHTTFDYESDSSSIMEQTKPLEDSKRPDEIVKTRPKKSRMLKKMANKRAEREKRANQPEVSVSTKAALKNVLKSIKKRKLSKVNS